VVCGDEVEGREVPGFDAAGSVRTQSAGRPGTGRWPAASSQYRACSA